MAKKTALDELSKWANENKEWAYPQTRESEHMISMNDIQKKIAELRATTEKEIIKEAYAASAAERFHKGPFGRNAEQWYNETYGTDE